MKISIIIPVYNSGKDIGNCLDSIISQSYKNLEIILVNDGSTDNSEEICKKYEKKDKRIKYIFIKNSGVAFARNTGLENATGDYIGFVDSDDYVESDMYEYLLNNSVKNDSEISVCSFYKEFDDKKDINYSTSKSLVFKREKYPQAVYYETDIQGYLWNKIYARKLIYDKNNKIKVKFENDIFNLSDDLFNLRIYEFNKDFNIYFGDEKKYHYVQRNNSITYQKYTLKKLSCLKVRLREIEILNKNNVSSDYLKFDFCSLFLINKILIRKNKIIPNKLYYEMQAQYNEYIKQIKISNLEKKHKIKYIVIKYLPYIYVIKTLMLNNKK